MSITNRLKFRLVKIEINDNFDKAYNSSFLE